MGMSEGQQESAQIQGIAAGYENQLFNLGKPGLNLSLSQFVQDLGTAGSTPQSIASAFGNLSNQTNQYFYQQEKQAPGELSQVMKQQGGRYAAGAQSDASKQILANLETSRLTQQRQLKEQETDASLSQRDFDLSNLLGIASGGISTSFGYGQAAAQAAALNTANPGGGALSGAISGATAGTTINPGWGTLIGGLVGAGVGYFEGGG